MTVASSTLKAATSTPQVIDLEVQSLVDQINRLQALINELAKEGAGPIQIKDFKTNLFFGQKKNPEVKRLQQFLIQKKLLDAGSDDGSFLETTKNAVKKYQKLNGISQTGLVGPLTRIAINNQRKIDASIQTRVFQILTEGVKAQQKLQENFKVLPRPQYDASIIASEIFTRINQKRQKTGAQQLTWSNPAAIVAKLHSENQAEDNTIITDSNAICTYPFIRHEGFDFGFTVGERFNNKNVAFSKAGENILIMPISKNLIYTHRPEENFTCADIPNPIIPKDASKEEKTKIIRDALSQRMKEMENVKRVAWVNKEWLTVDEIAVQAVDGWMKSEGHRENLLDPAFEESGVGVAIVNDYLIATQVFIER